MLYLLLATVRWAQKRWQQRALQPVFGISLALLLTLQIGAGWKNLYIDEKPFAWGFYPETTVVGRYLHAHPDEKFILYAGNWPQDALTFLAMTDIKNPGAGFVHYQNYNTPSGDGLPEIERDLANGTISRPAHFIVDVGKSDAFSAGLGAKYRLQNEGELLREGAPVARLFLLK